MLIGLRPFLIICSWFMFLHLSASVMALFFVFPFNHFCYKILLNQDTSNEKTSVMLWTFLHMKYLTYETYEKVKYAE